MRPGIAGPAEKIAISAEFLTSCAVTTDLLGCSRTAAADPISCGRNAQVIFFSATPRHSPTARQITSIGR
jgi:hypothetical protein